MPRQKPVEFVDINTARQAVAQEMNSQYQAWEQRIKTLIQRLENAIRLRQGKYTAEQVARIYLGGKRTAQTIKRWCREEGLPHIRVNGLWLIDRQELEAWFEEQSE